MKLDKNNHLPTMTGPVCPVPLSQRDNILMGHGSGGKMMNDLIQSTFLPPLDNQTLRSGDDAGVVQVNTNTRIAISTDAHVVSPLFFSGGDIGKLAICGTVNDVAMMGAVPRFITASFILEEGLEVSILERVIQSMKEAAEEAGVIIVAGDTKVVQKGKADGLYITTAGVGTLREDVDIRGSNAQPGDIVILSGTMGDHGIAVLCERGELGFESKIKSDIAPLNHLVQTMLEVSTDIHVLRDPTRGGVASTLNEISTQSGVGILIQETALPVDPNVQAACEILGFDPLYVANEGKLIAITPSNVAEPILDAIKKSNIGEDAAIIGEVTDTPIGKVLMKTSFGSTRVVDVLSGEMLPRIC
jgi:hydrogenase expression/formation protein HypE